jgi:2-phosphosulfolactate phosphatase
MIFDQAEYGIRCEWGEKGILQLAPISDVIILVDVMSFSTCVSIAVSRGAIVYPYRFKDETSLHYVQSMNAELAGVRENGKYSLSPVSMLDIPQGTRIVLPSPNGSTLALSTGNIPTLTGCFRNAKAVAETAMKMGNKIGIIPAGEKWELDNSLRFAIEDIIGAGAIIQHIQGNRSPEAQMAVDIYKAVSTNLLSRLKECSSGKELISRGFEKDITLISEVDADLYVPILKENAFVRAK